MTPTSATILFDGVCNLCNGFVQFVIKRDAPGYFRFASLQSAKGQEIMIQHGLQLGPVGPETVLLVEHGQVYSHSTAVLRITRHLGSGWPLLYGFILWPKALRDATYRFVARHRYQWFGQNEACLLPTPELRQRFLL